MQLTSINNYKMISSTRLYKLLSTVAQTRCFHPAMVSQSIKKPRPEIPKNSLKEVFSASEQRENGAIYDKKPFKLTLEAGKKYSWCLCGKSKSQPLCDGTHKDVFLKIAQRPIRFTVEETKDYWLCNCKQTKNRPFCDGTHKQKEIQDANVKV